MVINFERDNLLNAVNIVSKAAATKTTMSILECILIQASSGTVTLTATDNELGIKTSISEGCDIIEEGSTAVEAKLFSEIVRKIDSDNDSFIKFETNGSIVDITSENSHFKIQEKDPEQFPELPEISLDTCITVSQFTLKELIRDTIFSIAPNDSNKMMTGELFEVKGNVMKATALDGHRISIRSAELKKEYEGLKAIIPGKTLTEISRILDDDIEKDVDIFFEKSNILFRFDSTIMTSRLIDGEYFRIDAMLSSDYDTKVTVNKKELIEHLERAAILQRETDKKPLVMNITDNSMSLKLNTVIGSLSAVMSVSKMGNDIMIGFNPKFILDALRVIDDEEVSLYMTNSKAPCFIRDENASYIYLILPINFNPAAY